MFPGLEKLNIMQLHSPASAITSAIVFNALIIVALIPLALRGVRYTPSSASALLRRNLWIYGVGGLVIPFAGIKLIDLIVPVHPRIQVRRCPGFPRRPSAHRGAPRDDRVHGDLRHRLSAGDDRDRPGGVPGPGRRLAGQYNGQVVGSSLLCQEFTDAKGNPLPQYFQPRPSNAVNPDSKTDYGCDPGFSGASNLGPDNSTLTQDVNTRRAAIAKFDGVSPASVPPDAVTASGSGLDPDISPQNADIQVNRVARARGLSAASVQKLVSENTQGRNIGILGEPRVDVLNLNIALDKLSNR